MKQRLEEARSFLEELAEKPLLLPCEPTLAPLLFSATRADSDASIADISTLVERSPTLASRVLTIANSACYALESTVTSLYRAVIILGFNEVRALVLMLGANAALQGSRNLKEFDGQALWRHQLHTAAIAKSLSALSRESGDGDPLLLEPDDAYAAGLLHDIGKTIIAERRPQVWLDIHTLASERNISFVQAEI
jgi:HD-like signal output (HDOD) protein